MRDRLVAAAESAGIGRSLAKSTCIEEPCHYYTYSIEEVVCTSSKSFASMDRGRRQPVKQTIVSIFILDQKEPPPRQERGGGDRLDRAANANNILCCWLGKKGRRETVVAVTLP